MMNKKLPLLLLLLHIAVEASFGQAVPRSPVLPSGSAVALLEQQQQPQPSPPPRRGTPEVGDEDEDVVRVDTSLVTVPVSVVDREGKFVPNLTKDDFRIYENGVEQRVAHFAPVERPFTVLLVLDTSQSTFFRLSDMQNAAIAFVEQLRPHDRVMVISFSNVLSIKNEPTNDREKLRQAIRQTRTGGGTSLYPAVDFILNRTLKQIPGRKAVVMFTDGADSAAANGIVTPFRATFESTVWDAEEAEALIYPIQYETMQAMLKLHHKRFHKYIKQSNERATEYLRALAQRTGGQVYSADSMVNLNEAFARIAEVLRWQYGLSYYPGAPVASGERRQLKVRVGRPDVSVRARASYVKE